MSDFIPGQVIVCDKSYFRLDGPYPLSHPEGSYTHYRWVYPGTPVLFWKWLGSRDCVIFHDGQKWRCDSRAYEVVTSVADPNSKRLKVKKRRGGTCPFPDWRVVTEKDAPWYGEENE